MEKSISSDLIRGHIDTIILHSLTSGNKYAQQISDFIEEKSESKYVINQATLYSSLKRLENLKLVSAYWNDTESGKGRRRYFKITEKGTEFVNENLSNWAYSRSIINKLMDTPESSPVKTQIIEKIVEVPVEVIKEVPKLENLAVETSKPLTTISTQPNPTNSNEVNFRAILGGLIETQNASAMADTEILEPIEKIDNVSVDDKPKFNDTITKETLSQRKNNVNKIDFGDLVIKANQDGYKLRISSKEAKINKGSLPINKVRFISSLSLFLICLLQMLLIVTTQKAVLKPSVISIVLFTLGIAIFPIVSTCLYFIKPSKTAKEVHADSILTALIIVFNVLIVTVALNLLFGADLTNKYTLLTCLITPCLLAVDVIVYFVIKYFVAKRITNRNKK